MKTTFELPDDLAKRIKIRAAERGQKLKITVAQRLEIGLQYSQTEGAPHRLQKPVKLRGYGPLNIEDIETSIADGRC